MTTANTIPCHSTAETRFALRSWWWSICAFALCGMSLAGAKSPTLVVNPNYRLVLNSDSGGLESLRATSGAEREFLIPRHGQLPLFKVEFLEDGKFRKVTSASAKKITVTRNAVGRDDLLVLEFTALGGLAVDARVTVRCPADKSLTYWRLEIDNRTTMWIANLQFPVVEVPFDHTAPGRSSRILSSIYDGMLTGPVEPEMVAGAWRSRRADTPEAWRSSNYPRDCTAQLMAYYDQSAGLYLACEDAAGRPKLISPLIASDGVVLGLGHFPAAAGPGRYTLPYEVALGTFRGDWYAAAEIYRAWAEQQPFCARKIAQRTDLPSWLFSPVVGVAFPMRGQGDWDPPAAPNSDYVPPTNALPHLERLAAAFDAPLMPIVFNWEKAGPWTQPESFPPVGGEAEMKAFMAKARAKGWHPVLYGDGLYWVVKQNNTGYDGAAYFKAQGGESTIVHRWDDSTATGESWRKLYPTCVATPGARNMVMAMTRGIAELGADVVQQFDQGVGAFPCYARDHGHPPLPGPWMTTEFVRLAQEHRELARSLNPAGAVSCEGAPPEVFLQQFDFWDGRTGGGGSLNCNLYSFLYHEYLPAHAGFYVNAVNDEALLASVARALVSGYFLNFTLREKGLIEFDWNQTWHRGLPDQPAILDWARRATRLRFGIARDYLVFGRMLRPWKVRNVGSRDFGYGPEPLVQSATWKAPDGRIGVVLANYSNVKAVPHVEIEGEARRGVVIRLDDTIRNIEVELPAVVDLEMPPRSLGLIELK